MDFFESNLNVPLGCMRTPVLVISRLPRRPENEFFESPTRDEAAVMGDFGVCNNKRHQHKAKLDKLDDHYILRCRLHLPHFIAGDQRIQS